MFVKINNCNLNMNLVTRFFEPEKIAGTPVYRIWYSLANDGSMYHFQFMSKDEADEAYSKMEAGCKYV